MYALVVKSREMAESPRGDDEGPRRARAGDAAGGEARLRRRAADLFRHGKFFCFHRSRRPDAVDPETGERLDDVLVFRVADLGEKEVMVADDRGVFFTTPHWNGYSAVLVRIPSLERIDREELRDLVAEAWLTRAQKRVAKAWLAEQGLLEDE